MHLLLALRRFPTDTNPWDIARTEEQIGYVRRNLDALEAAKSSFSSAQSKYEALKNDQGSERARVMEQLISQINDLQAKENASVTSEPPE